MSKKKKKAPQPAKKKFPVIPVVVVSVVLVVGLIVLLSASSSKHSQNTLTRSFSVNGGETRPVLSPYQFYGMVREAYAAAQAIPQILDKLFCYCYCHNVPFKHKSLLSCFVTRHGAGWLLCQEEALKAFTMHKQGHTLDEIRSAIDAAFDK